MLYGIVLASRFPPYQKGPLLSSQSMREPNTKLPPARGPSSPNLRRMESKLIEVVQKNKIKKDSKLRAVMIRYRPFMQICPFVVRRNTGY